ncbi:MAG: hypothetical protein QXN20_05990 [Candidatus Bathyarchaeia archaeon]
MFDIHLTGQELAFIAVSASIWITAQIALGPLIGRVFIGPVSMHGTVNHVVGWFLMVVTASLLRRFGMVSMMTIVAAIGTRIIRMSALEGLLVGLGYMCAGVLFDGLFFGLRINSLKHRDLRLCLTIFTAASSGIVSLAPYLLFRLYALGLSAFTALAPLFVSSIIKNMLFSSFGAYMAFLVLPRITLLHKQQARDN